MVFSEYSNYDGLGLAELLRRQELTSADLVDSAIDAIERLNPRINCVVQQLHDEAHATISAGLPYGPFRGVPFLVKEFGMHFAGMISSAGSRVAEGYRHTEDSVMMQRCRAAGMVAVGTSTLPEMAFNASTEALLYGPTRNPWNPEYSAGGSPAARVRRSVAAWSQSRTPRRCRFHSYSSRRQRVVGMKVSRGRTPGGPDLGMLLWGWAWSSSRRGPSAVAAMLMSSRHQTLAISTLRCATSRLPECRAHATTTTTRRCYRTHARCLRDGRRESRASGGHANAARGARSSVRGRTARLRQRAFQYVHDSLVGDHPRPLHELFRA